MDLYSVNSFKIAVFSRWNLKKQNEANRNIITGVKNKNVIMKSSNAILHLTNNTTGSTQ